MEHTQQNTRITAHRMKRGKKEERNEGINEWRRSKQVEDRLEVIVTTAIGNKLHDIALHLKRNLLSTYF